MSKIYEALLRAEIDRLAAVENNHAPASPSPASLQSAAVGVASPENLLSRSVQAPPEPPQTSLPQALDAPAPTDRADRTLDEDHILRNPWNLVLPQLPALEDRGRSVEQFRSLRSRMYEFRDQNSLKSILISSALPQEGKSFIAANLAISFARNKAQRVLLIDGDMRRSSLHKMLGAPVEPGLTEYLAGKASLLDILQRPQAPAGATLPPGIASLSFIAGGADAENASDLSAHILFTKLMETVSPLFDWIVIDSAPVNLVADAVNLARSCDGVLLIARGGQTKFEAAQRALSEFKASRILGFVLNAVQKPPLAGGYYGYDNYDKVKE